MLRSNFTRAGVAGQAALLVREAVRYLGEVDRSVWPDVR
jgi:hypothetical protein